MTAVKSWRKRNDKGQALVEYALILVLVAIAAFVMLQTLGTGVSNIFQTVGGYLGAGT